MLIVYEFFIGEKGHLLIFVRIFADFDFVRTSVFYQECKFHFVIKETLYAGSEGNRAAVAAYPPASEL